MKKTLSTPEVGSLTATAITMLIGCSAGAAAATAAAEAGLSASLALAIGIAAAAPLAAASAFFRKDMSVRRLAQRSGASTVGVRSAASILEAIPVPLIVLGINGRLTCASGAARELLPRLSAGTPYSHVIRAPEFVQAVAASLEDGQARRVAFSASPGRERIFEAHIAPLPESGPLDGGRLVIWIDDRTEAQSAERLRSDFVANASHELRTPLAAIIGYIETLQHHARDDAGAREQFLSIMAREAARMQRLVDDLMSLSRIELVEHVRPRQPCALTEVAAEAAAALQPLAELQDVDLQILLTWPGPFVAGDRDQLCQVFFNLIDNAIKYAGPGATVRVREAPPSATFPNRVGISIEDTGPGIPREYLPRLTERFYRINAPQSRYKGGTGLGLAIVKHILNRHEGRLEIVSSLGKGSVFTVWMPRGRPMREVDSGSAPVTDA